MSRMDSDDLSEKLRAWRVEPELPSSFQRGVWQRIASRHEAETEDGIEGVRRPVQEAAQDGAEIRVRYGQADVA